MRDLVEVDVQIGHAVIDLKGFLEELLVLPELLLAHVGRVTDHRVEPRISLALAGLREEHLGELQLPMEENPLFGHVLNLLEPWLRTECTPPCRRLPAQPVKKGCVVTNPHPASEVCGGPDVGHMFERLKQRQDVVVELLLLTNVCHALGRLPE